MLGSDEEHKHACPSQIRSRGSTKRSWLRPQGCRSSPSVAKGNKIARRVCYLCLPQILKLLREETTHIIPSFCRLTCFAKDRILCKEGGALGGGTAHVKPSFPLQTSASVLATRCDVCS